MTELNDPTSFNEINQLATMKDVFDLIERKYPNWIVDLVDKYSDDYPHLQNNWQTLVNYSKTKMQKIIIVENFDNEEQLSFAELLTHAGFIVRTKVELIPCSVCNSAIPSETIYNKMKEHNIQFNFTWSNKCKNC
jgi:hypothetical protein